MVSYFMLLFEMVELFFYNFPMVRDLADGAGQISILQGLQSTKRDSYGRLILGDIITSVNGTKVTNGSDLYRILDQCKVGDKVWC